MEEQVDEDYSSVVDILLGMFREVLCKDAITTIVESCDGNLQESANIIMNITTDGEDCSKEENKTQVLDTNLVASSGQNKIYNHNMQSSNIQVTQNTSNQGMAQNKMMYSQTILSQPSSSTGALPKQLPKKSVHSKEESEELRQILKFHEEGTRTLILMRGAPGSGKSYMAKRVVDKIYNSHQPHLYSTHIFSTDDYFSQNNNNTYCFESSKLSHAHIWNQQRSYLAMSKGVSPVIIDNTNIEIWEMDCYIREGVKHGYIILILEPITPWAWKPSELAKRNMHNVPANKIVRMIHNYQHISINGLLSSLKLSYNTGPPVLRLIPEFTPKAESLLIEPQTVTSNSIIQNIDKIDDKIKKLQVSNNSNLQEKIPVHERGDKKESTAYISQQHCEETSELVYKEVEKKLEEFAKVENEWENSESWDDNSSNIDKVNKVSEPDQYVKPQRKKRSVKAPSENILSSIGDIQDWTRITMFMPTWNEASPTTKEDSIIPVEKVSSSTFMEIDDRNLSSTKNPLKIISAIPRDINEFHVRDVTEKIPETRMLDKSTSTNNDIMTRTGRCKNEEKHFNEFRKLFKFVNKADLRDIFDKCQGDVNWAVDIVLNDVSYKEVHSLNENLSDSETEEENNEQCECIAAYSVIPEINSSISDEIESPPPMEVTSSPLREKRKIKKDAPLSSTSVRLKQQIEKNIVISDDHYSNHCIKVRKKRRGEIDDEKTEKPTEPVPVDTSESNLNGLNGPSTSKLISTENSDVEYIDDESLGEEPEQTISIDVSKDLMSQLDQHFGWKEMIFSENISTKINVPISILNELNALWIESLLYQIEENEKQLDIMVKQDEEFARELAYKEAEMLQAGEELRKPDFKEIMDMDFAVSLYHKDVAQWRNNEPNDLAAKLTRDKLKALFPEVLPDSLAEILVAHDNNFERTVESLLISTGRGEILITENGISKFIKEKETENREKLIEKENEGQGLSETEWPSLPVIEKIDMEVVKKYRLEAEKHLKFRNMAHQKAQDMMKRGMLPAASYYSDIAAYHKTKYEHSNSYAAASLMHLHANNSMDGDTVDLHYLHVKEAKESLDLFLDEHIQRLRSEGGGRYQKLFLITGRGLHSQGRPRIKPAVKKRLHERGLTYSQCNPGLLSAKVCADDKLSYQVG